MVGVSGRFDVAKGASRVLLIIAAATALVVGLVTAAATYLGYASARLLGLALDGTPSSGIFVALGTESGLAVASLFALGILEPRIGRG